MRPQDSHTVVPSGGAWSSRDKTAGPVPVLSDYPELVPVLSLALDAVVSSFYPQRIGPDIRAYLERVTAAATVAIYAPMAEIARRSRTGAQVTRAARTAAVAREAGQIASCVAKVAAELQIREDASADTVARDVASAAELVVLTPGSGPDTRRVATTAAGVAVAAREAATAALLERARAAATVAQAASVAAAEVAASADAAAVEVELEVFRAASVLQGIALETCYQVAINFAASAGEAVLADGLPD